MSDENLLLLPPGSHVTLLTDTQVVNLEVVSVRERTRCIELDDIPADATVIGVKITPHSSHSSYPEEAE